MRILAAAFLIAAGVGAFHWAKYSPRCVIVSDAHAIHFSDDGNVLVTGHTGTQIGNWRQGGDSKPPLKVWDTRSGALVRSLLTDVKAFRRYDISSTANLIAVDLGGDAIRVANWQTGDEWRIDVGPGLPDRMTFSPRGDLLFIRLKEHPYREVMIDLASRAIVHRFEPGTQGSHFTPDGSHWRFVMKQQLYLWNTVTHKIDAELPVGIFHADDRWFVVRDSKDLSLVLHNAESMAVTASVRPALPPKFHLIKSFDTDAWALIRMKVEASRDYIFSPSGKRLATYARSFDGFNGALEVWDAGTGRQIAAFPTLERGYAYFVSDDTIVFFDQSHTPVDPLAYANFVNAHGFVPTATLIDVPSGSIRWKRPAAFGKFLVFREDFVVHLTPEGTWDLLDLATGESRSSLPHPFAADGFRASFTTDKNLICVYGRRREPPLPAFLQKWLARWLAVESGAVQILDTSSKRMVFELNTAVDSGAVISKDCRTLLSFDFSGGLGFSTVKAKPPTHPAYHFRFYDLDNAVKPWIWALAAPAGIVILSLLWRRWRASRVNRASPGQEGSNGA